MVSDQIIQVLDALCQKVGLVFDWTNQNIIPYVQELTSKFVTYKLTLSYYYLILSVFFIILSIIAIVVFVKNFYLAMNEPEKVNARYKIDGFGDYLEYVPFSWFKLVGMILGCITILISFDSISDNIIQIITCYTFPEKIILDEIKQLMQQFPK